jgi:hypothetical protein
VITLFITVSSFLPLVGYFDRWKILFARGEKEAVRELLQGQMHVGRHLSRDFAGVALQVSYANFGGQNT